MFCEKKEPNRNYSQRTVFRIKKDTPIGHKTVKFHFENTTTTIEFSSGDLMEKLISTLQKALDEDTEPENDNGFILTLYSENYQSISDNWPGINITSKFPVYGVERKENKEK